MPSPNSKSQVGSLDFHSHQTVTRSPNSKPGYEQRKLSGEPRSMRQPQPQYQWKPCKNLDLHRNPAEKRHTSISHWGGLGESGLSPWCSDEKSISLSTQCQWRPRSDSELIPRPSRNKGHSPFPPSPMFNRGNVENLDFQPLLTITGQHLFSPAGQVSGDAC